MGIRLLGYSLISIAVVIAGVVVYLNNTRSEVPLIFSPTQMLGALWVQYKQEYVEAGTYRTLDKQRSNVTTSEGQSYTMLRAVWMGDKETFDRAWQWTQDNLSREDNLFAWLFGQRSDGSWGILTSEGGSHTASDADQDIALALIFAYNRWQDPSYLASARAILADLWEKEVLVIRGTPYLASNNLEKFSQSPTAIINPSYLAPYAYRIFAQVDTERPWGALVDSSYELIGRAMDAGLGSESADLPPDWVRIHKTTGALSAPGGGLTTNFGYDAMRTPWRLALDYAWWGNERARDLLMRMSFLSDEWHRSGRIATTYAHDGTLISTYETPAMYGGAIGHFTVADQDAAKALYEQKLLYLYNPGTNAWKDPLSYYDDNWAWFGIGLYHGLLPNLATLPAAAYLP